ncbi:hypothetical protein BLNAU_5259 [Blattamonas nauphoetae]|uniref:Uncharacterized protein n=1 Tax=Blattamonas nauphoetae TaxID=2049346 RepID=A0ABQ9Y7N2_9EUKA|nr:hypothetical protein BLNAU_5259 [Blattamonas nauphoetae]
MLKQTPQDDDAITLPISTTSDWRLVLQDSITADTLRQGCISLFEQVNSEQNFTPIEMNHATRFLEYAHIHVKYRKYPYNKPHETILSEDVTEQTNLTSALLKLVCHPSNTLQMAALSFLDASISKSFPRESRFAVAVTRLLPQLLERLKPHEIPLNGTTIKFHRHLISILDKFFSISSTADIKSCLEIRGYPPLAEILQSEKLELIFKISFEYLRSLIAAPVCSPDTHSGFILLSTMQQFREIVQNNLSHAIFPEVTRFFGEIRKDIVEKLALMLGFPSTNEVELCLHSDWMYPKLAEPWLSGFLYLLTQVREETQFSDLEILAVMIRVGRREYI